ncbi:MAG TPA: nucleoside triphosphate pyrophosphohydrolase [Methylomusa anaerophila]|uniref:Nucleoside triphosphate pyrophosphohydrolase n=1 Tax=Methylomusa anaerophila TaxID=1930071 RepID=A0A348AJI6_9FIRM|nr:nucleoside triphosphate pyrophosphohydrolase [Methylomusa anaerophila]BBB91234.1 nucleoside triphosphate pyrophosphohydrolase [Methylomusa anaerophila]HML89772.1 nucleoside triphosphate pyrophosphohydrolase [Methylomusa anaerophila]
MVRGEINIIGLGPGSFNHITLETWDTIKQAKFLLLRTAIHPSVAGLTERGLIFESFDRLYEKFDTFDHVYQAIADAVIEKAKTRGQVVYAVPGSPLVAEKTVEMIISQTQGSDIKVHITPGMSFLEVLYARLRLDPINGVTILDAADLRDIPPNLNTALVITQVFSRQVASNTKLLLMDHYDDEFPVTFVRNLGMADEEITTIPLFELDRQPAIDHLTSVYIPPKPQKAKGFSLDPVVDVMARLRSPGGCVWDIEQTHASLRRYIVEEVYEVLEAIDLADGDKLCEELGDLLLQIIFHARIAEECGIFSMQDVIDQVTEKMVRRHPHVFGNITVRDAAEVIANWEQIKKQEKAGERTHVLDGVPKGLPSLMSAYKLQAKAAKVGFDWDDIGPVWDKVAEELEELRAAACQAGIIAGKQDNNNQNDNNYKNVEAELGDVLFTIVNLARFMGVEPETALNAANKKFMRRFDYIESKVKESGKNWDTFTLNELNWLWNEAKHSQK